MFNRVKDGSKETQIKHIDIKNIPLIDSWFKQSCIKEAISINAIAKNKKVIFGGKKNFISRCKGLISKEEFQENRLSPIYSIGESSNPSVKSNRKFQLCQDLKTIVFKPDRKTKIELQLPNLRPNLLNILSNLYKRQEQKNFSISFKLDQQYIYVIFNEKDLSDFHPIDLIDNRVLSLDLNPNYIGWSVVDWLSENEFNIIDKGIYSLKQINDKEIVFKELKLSTKHPKRIHLNNKRKFEVLQISKDLINKALHFKCEIVAVEDLNIKSSNKEKGKRFNHQVNNQWLRTDFINNLNKRCNIFHIKFLKTKAEYSSFIGNFLYGNLNLPDQILSSIEISRRSYEFNLQYIKKIKNKKKNIVFPDLNLFKNNSIKSLEEFKLDVKNLNLLELYYFLKNSKIKYRVSLESISESKVFSLKYRKSLVKCYMFQ